MAIPVAFPVWAQRGAGSCANGLKTIRYVNKKLIFR